MISSCGSTTMLLPPLTISYPPPGDHSEFFFSPEATRALTNQRTFCQGTSAGFQLFSVSDSKGNVRSAAALVIELRKLSGLKWEKVAELLDVSPKTVHNWVAGNAIAEKNLGRLAELVAVIRFVDRGYGEANRDLLMSSSKDGDSLFSLLAASEWETVKSVAGKGQGRPDSTAPLGREAMRFTASEHFGEALSLSIEDQTSEILPLLTPGKRTAKARRKRR